jgi:hypothetical protein
MIGAAHEFIATIGKVLSGFDHTEKPQQKRLGIGHKFYMLLVSISIDFSGSLRVQCTLHASNSL